MDFVYKFPVVRGKQAKKEYYIAMVPLKMLSRLFPSDDEYVLPEYRAQRKLNEARCKSRPRRPPCTEFQLQPAGDSAPPYRRLAPPCGIQTALVFSLPEPA